MQILCLLPSSLISSFNSEVPRIRWLDELVTARLLMGCDCTTARDSRQDDQHAGRLNETERAAAVWSRGGRECGSQTVSGIHHQWSVQRI